MTAPPTLRIDDAAIRAALRERFQAFGVRLVEEWNVGACRVDLCAISHDALHAYEIKSPLDSISRLDRQARNYSRTFDQCTLVAPALTHTRVDRQNLVPAWWGRVIVAPLAHGSGFRLEVEKAADQNPATDAAGVAWMLWRTEMRLIAYGLGIKQPYRMSKPQLVRALAERFTRAELAPIAVGHILRRSDWKQGDGAVWSPHGFKVESNLTPI